MQVTLSLVAGAEHGQLPAAEDVKVVDFFRATLGEAAGEQKLQYQLDGETGAFKPISIAAAWSATRSPAPRAVRKPQAAPPC